MQNKNILIVGAAGFIGFSLVYKFLNEGHSVFGVDNLLTGKNYHLDIFKKNSNFKFNIFDFSDPNMVEIFFKELYLSNTNINEIWHLAANSDIFVGNKDINLDYNNTFLTTLYLLDAMKKYSIPRLFFASSSAVYGDLGNTILNESTGPLLPISNYGAMKLASEAIISAATESYLKYACIFRFPNVVGVPATHGVIFDFINKLKLSNNNLKVLGDGTQKKPYLHVSDLISAMYLVSNRKVNTKIDLFNIGPHDDGVTVRFIAEQVVNYINPKASITYGIGNKGWMGDVPVFKYSTNRINSIGWSAKFNSKEAIIISIKEIRDQIFKIK